MCCRGEENLGQVGCLEDRRGGLQSHVVTDNTPTDSLPLKQQGYLQFQQGISVVNISEIQVV